MFCATCGAEIQDAAVICPKCGVPTPNFKQPEAPKADQAKPAVAQIGTGTIVLSYILALLMPILGVIAAIYLFVKGKTGHGLGVLGVSIAEVVVYIAVMS